MTTEAERLADAIDPFTRKHIDNLTCSVAATELRRLAAENAALRAALAQPEQEPVAWLTTDSQDGLWHPTAFKKHKDDRPLYAAPTIPARSYWLIERNQAHGEPSARWFSERRVFAQGDNDLWVQDATKAQRFETQALAERSIADRFVGDKDRYPVLPVATEHIDCAAPTIPAGMQLVPMERWKNACAIIQTYANLNPKWWNDSIEQDPGGAHAWLAAAKEKP